jgi:hypothetical protein
MSCSAEPHCLSKVANSSKNRPQPLLSAMCLRSVDTVVKALHMTPVPKGIKPDLREA